jgi:hypothetical protein
MKITDNNRAEIIKIYVQSIILNRWNRTYDSIVNDLNKYTNEELEKEIGEFSPEILENI